MGRRSLDSSIGSVYVDCVLGNGKSIVIFLIWRTLLANLLIFKSILKTSLHFIHLPSSLQQLLFIKKKNNKIALSCPILNTLWIIHVIDFAFGRVNWQGHKCDNSFYSFNDMGLSHHEMISLISDD